MRKISSILMTVLLGALCLTGCGSTDNNTATDRNVSSAAVSSPAADAESNVASDNEDSDLLSGKHHIKIKVKDYGTISVELDADVAPITVTNFVDLAKDGFYDGLTFHRIISGFMIQGGCPDGTGMGGPGYSIKGEFKQNGFANDLKHEPGVLSMARAMHPDSAGSQFFIMHKTSPHLDGAYAAFGKVTEGMDVVNKIAETATDYSDRPLEEQKMKKVTVETFGEAYPEPERV